MPSYRAARVTEVLSARRGLQKVATDAGRAYVLTQLVGPVAAGDPVVLNTTAVELGLGTGGWHFVHWNLARREWSEPGRGHVMKLRYTGLQVDTGAAEEAHPDLPQDLGGMPVVACGLHSQVGCVAAVLGHLAPVARVAYVMTDGAALPLALSDLVADMVQCGLISVTVTAGHAFGGDLEAVSAPSALAVARHLGGADVAIVGMGPGAVGTASPLGATALEVAGVLDAAAALGGRPIACVRASWADTRPRHQGVSHHTRAVLALVRSPVEVAVVPELADALPGAVVLEPPDMAGLLAAAGLRVTTMGRGPAEDPLFFATAGAAGALAARRLARRG